MSSIEKCIKCEHYESIYDGYGFCTNAAMDVTVVANYEPTKNYNWCERREEYKPKEIKTAYQMQYEGWCDDCAADVNECIKQSECEGYRRFKNEQN